MTKEGFSGGAAMVQKIRVPKLVSINQELMFSGHLACAGCGMVLSHRLILKILGPKTIVVVPACCFSVIHGDQMRALNVPMLNIPFETAAAAASGLARALKIKGDDGEITILAWAGDGGTFDIGLQALSGAAERNENILYVCYDNEAYMNTGVQKSSATPLGAWTNTSLSGAEKDKKDIVEILASHKIPYIAKATLAFPEDFARKVQKAKEIKGMKFIHLFSPCPTGWQMEERLTVEIARLAVACRIFPLLEVQNGERYFLNKMPAQKPVEKYLKLQGRYSHLTSKDIDQIQESVNKVMKRLRKLAHL
jgi:pyruvate/2-oxoacid:ferredoxin oxidoreductase beta subunit